MISDNSRSKGFDRINTMSDNAKRIFLERYCLGDETIEDSINRVVDHVTQARPDTQRDLWKDKYFNHIATFTGVPNTPTFTGAGTPLAQLSACFTLDIQDSIESIMETLKDAVLIQKSGGGLGFNFSNIRPKNALINSTLKKSPGVISWLIMYDQVFANIMQAARRAANMGILRCDHPDILDFIHCKQNEYSITYFNLSILFDYEFMTALSKDEEIDLWWTNPQGERIVERRIKAQKIWDEFLKNTYRFSEPSALYQDNINVDNPLVNVYGLYDVCNPCNEVPMKQYESCNLSCLGLDNFASWDKTFDWNGLKEAIRINTYLLNDIVSTNFIPVEKSAEMNRKYRRIANGITGLHDAMLKLGLPYDSEKARNFTKKIMAVIRYYAMLTSTEIAETEGIVFEDFDKSIYASGLKNLSFDFKPYFTQGEIDYLDNRIKTFGLANSHFTTIAPTGTRSTVGDKGGYGIEPIFALSYRRWVMANDGTLDRYSIHVVPKIFEEYLDEFHPNNKDEILEAISDNKGSAQGLDQFFSVEEQELLKVANDISPLDHVLILAQAQIYNDTGISKTINCPANVSIKDLDFIFKQAWKMGVKGLTVYRDGSRDKVVIETETKEYAVEIVEFTDEVINGSMFSADNACINCA